MCVEEWGVCKNGVCVLKEGVGGGEDGEGVCVCKNGVCVLKEGVGGVRMVRVCVCVRMVCVCV